MVGDVEFGLGVFCGGLCDEFRGQVVEFDAVAVIFEGEDSSYDVFELSDVAGANGLGEDVIDGGVDALDFFLVVVGVFLKEGGEELRYVLGSFL